jgi:Cu(I)/Ag(I) efflux system periplasmic protein CusF
MRVFKLAVAGIMALGLSDAAFSQGEPMVTGTVTKVDKSAEKITINHGPIKKLDMEAMSMVFRAGDKAMLDQVKPGDKIRFTADRVNGQITVTKIQKGR